MKNIIIPLALILSNTACVQQYQPDRNIIMNSETTEISGWLSSKGEWALFPNKKISQYNPYKTNDDKKCVSLINKTGISRYNFDALDHKYVSIIGFSVEYDELMNGKSPVDKLLSKKYYESERVENFCLRKFVFVVTEFSSGV